MPSAGQDVAISLRVGMDFKGNSFPFVREHFRRFAVIDRNGERSVKGIDGDDPALKTKFSRSGLAIFAYHSTPSTTTFDDWAEFEAYLQVEGLEWIKPVHVKFGKPTTGIKESYSRCAKLLLNVGAGPGQDRFTGMPLELVAERNPNEVSEGESLPVRLYYNGKPINDVQITAFSKGEPGNKQKVRTDEHGRAQIMLNSEGPWLLNAVHMIEPPRGDPAHWTSLWASMTLARR